MKTTEPIFTIDLFLVLDQKLTEVLQSLAADDWNRQTIAPRWKVKDVAAHLLDGNIRGIAIGRDKYAGNTAPQIYTYGDLVAFLNELNASWVAAAQRISPALLTGLLELTGRQYYEYLKTLDPFEEAVFSVAWAGEQISRNWFHIAREYTEKWHHQQQIRLAVGQENELLTSELYFPFLATAMRALPHHYRTVDAAEGDTVAFTVTNDGGTWFLKRNAHEWQLVDECEETPIAQVRINHTIAWRIFTRGISGAEARDRIEITGRQALGEPILNMLAVMA